MSKDRALYLEMRSSGSGDLFVSITSLLNALDVIEKEGAKEPIKVFRRLVSESEVAFANWVKFQEHQNGEIH